MKYLKQQKREAKTLDKDNEFTAVGSKQTEELDLDQTIDEETAVKKTSTSVHKGHLAARFLPGQSESGEIPSTNLTSPEFTKIQRKPIASQKFPCIMSRLHDKSKKVK